MDSRLRRSRCPVLRRDSGRRGPDPSAEDRGGRRSSAEARRWRWPRWKNRVMLTTAASCRKSPPASRWRSRWPPRSCPGGHGLCPGRTAAPSTIYEQLSHTASPAGVMQVRNRQRTCFATGENFSGSYGAPVDPFLDVIGWKAATGCGRDLAGNDPLTLTAVGELTRFQFGRLHRRFGDLGPDVHRPVD